MKCPTTKHPVVANADGEVYEAEGRFGPERFACAYSNGRASALGPKPEYTPSGGGGVEKETLGGSVIAYEKFVVVSEGHSDWMVIVLDLRTGRVLHRVASMGGFVQSLVVRSDGSVAWIVDEGGKPEESKVVSVDKTGTHTLAAGVGIAPMSLALAGSTLYWTQNRTPFSALLN
ncbi:MAG TPA: hypothetical protein VGN25_07705 [Solirubrobacteraceae bacterium]|jgi:hypothetical protein|nr:hypothetical protein [Solirubrobacteraceae bacterium]